MERSLSSFYPPKELWPEFILPLDRVAIPEKVNLTEELLEKQIRDGREEETAIYFQQQRITFNTLIEKVTGWGRVMSRGRRACSFRKIFERKDYPNL